VVAACAVVALTGCGKSGTSVEPKASKPLEPAKVAPGQERQLFPLVVGNQWVYESHLVAQGGNRMQEQDAIVTIKVQSVTDDAGKTKAIVEATNDQDDSKDRQVWIVDNTGIYQSSVGRKPIFFEPLQPVVKFPVQQGDKFTWKGKGYRPLGSPGSYTAESVVLASEEVDTGLGKMSAIPVESVANYRWQNRDVQVRSTAWWVPKIGFVRYVVTVSFPEGGYRRTLRLKSHSLK
jgi:hypothetical protein